MANSHHVLIAIVHGRSITQSRNPFKSFRGAVPYIHAHHAAAGQTDKCNPLDLQISFCIVRDKRKLVFCTIDPRQAGHWQRQVSLLLPLWLNTDNPLKLSLSKTWRLWWGGNKKCGGFPWLSWHISCNASKGSWAHSRAQHVHHCWALTNRFQQVLLGQLEGLLAPGVHPGPHRDPHPVFAC